jgi:hypothetical protein
MAQRRPPAGPVLHSRFLTHVDADLCGSKGVTLGRSVASSVRAGLSVDDLFQVARQSMR